MVYSGGENLQNNIIIAEIIVIQPFLYFGGALGKRDVRLKRQIFRVLPVREDFDASRHAENPVAF